MSQNAGLHLQALPPEIFEQIVSNIEETTDLLALAQTAKLFSAIILPAHLGYRFIRAYIGEKRLWKHLKEHPYLAKNVYHLEVGSAEAQRRMPPILEQYPDNQHPMLSSLGFGYSLALQGIETILCFFDALEIMTNLKKFTWVVQISDHESRRILDALILRIFKVVDANPSHNTDSIQLHKLDTISSAIYPGIFSKQYFRALTHLTFSNIHVPMFDARIDYSPMTCASALTHLFLAERYPRPTVDENGLIMMDTPLPSPGIFDLLEFATWPLLRKLSLPGFYPPTLMNNTWSGLCLLKAFLTRHPKLEALYLPDVDLERNWNLLQDEGTGPEKFLPNLTTLNICNIQRFNRSALTDLEKWMASHVIKRLEYISLELLPDNIHLIDRFSSLKACHLTGNLETLQLFVKLAPQIERVHFRMTETGESLDVALQILSSLKNLTHLALLRPCDFTVLPSLIYQCLSKFAKVKYVQLRHFVPTSWENMKMTWYKVIRDKQGGFWELQELDKKQQTKLKCGVEYWGDFYYGALDPLTDIIVY